MNELLKVAEEQQTFLRQVILEETHFSQMHLSPEQLDRFQAVIDAAKQKKLERGDKG